ncbi:MAG TPA: alpha/beta hydrolase family protein, partial [Chitinophagaceae bacterium]|nr:alpha/beta hydrolase family protein [Chitinophagaceae bacterium]
MKCKVLTLLLSLVCLTALSQKEYKVYDWKTEYSFNAHLSQLMHRQYEQRQHNFQRALKSTDSLQEYIHSVRTRFKEILGQLPPQTPLNAKVVRSTISTRFSDHKILIQYRRERILFESFPGHHVTATLYIPTGKEQDPIGRSPYPGLLFLCGHEDAGKATPSYQQLAGELVESGFVVLVVDPLSQSERHQLTGSNGKPLTRGGTTEHTLINAASNLVGTSAAAYELWDNKRALDYLLTRPEVDTSRIGVLGNSGGAIQAMYLLAFEPRIKATAVNSYLSSRARTFDLTGPADGCAHIPGEGRALLEMSDYLIAAAPRPVLVTAGRFDFIDFEGTKLAVRELEQVYGLLGKPSHVKFSMYEDGHGYSLQKNQATVFFFQEALYDSVLGTKSHIHEILSDTALFVTGAGQVNAAFSNEVTVFERNLQLANELKSSRKQFLSQSRDSIINKIAELLALDRGWKAGPNGGGRSFKRKGIEYRTYELQLNGEVPVPIILADTFLHR